MNITYEKRGDYLIPNLISDPEPEGELRKFGLMRKFYLKNYKRGIYAGLLLSGELKKHLLIIQNQAESICPIPQLGTIYKRIKMTIWIICSKINLEDYT